MKESKIAKKFLLVVLILLLLVLAWWWRVKSTREVFSPTQQQELATMGVDYGDWTPDAIVENDEMTLEMKLGN